MADWVELPEPLTVDEAELERWWKPKTLVAYEYLGTLFEEWDEWSESVEELRERVRWDYMREWRQRVQIHRYCPG